MYSVKIVKDSVNPVGDRITTFELQYPRMVHAELMTHRMFCLSGDSELEFDLPSGQTGGGRRVHRMRLDDFVDKWTDGARRVGAKPKRATDLSWIDDDKFYTSNEVALRLGMAHASNINKDCRSKKLEAEKRGREWYLKGSTVRSWRLSALDATRFDMRDELSNMRIRQLNETTNDIQTAHVSNAWRSGKRPVYKITAGEFSVAGSKDHRVMTAKGWKPICEISAGDYIVVRKFGKRDSDKLDPDRLRKIDGTWRSGWQTGQRNRLRNEDELCRICGVNPGEDIHHIIPVHEDKSLALVESNITLLCIECHSVKHATQGWQGGTYLYGAIARVDSVSFRGEEETYDLEIAGDFPNFIANGIVVHNSRSSASSRAIPIKRMIRQVEDDPVMFKWWGKNQSGMQAKEELTGVALENAKETWLAARDSAVKYAWELNDLGLHKQSVNRILEPWMFITVILTSTEFENWYNLRDDPDAQPEIAWVAREMRKLHDSNEPEKLALGEWHLPYIELRDDRSPLYIDIKRLIDSCGGSGRGAEKKLMQIATARCARVSYLTHDGKRDYGKDIELHDRCRDNCHWSPFEHCAEADDRSGRHGNFVGWRQYRKLFKNEHSGRKLEP